MEGRIQNWLALQVWAGAHEDGLKPMSLLITKGNNISCRSGTLHHTLVQGSGEAEGGSEVRVGTGGAVAGLASAPVDQLSWQTRHNACELQIDC